jgi:hypothetical protein
MQINWCLRGIVESPTFNDAAAADVVTSTGIVSKWVLTNRNALNYQANIDAQSALSASALDDHVNNFSKVATNTPYISLSSGCYEYAGSVLPPIRYPAIQTALNFATNGGKVAGYVFRCWVIAGLQPAAELPGLAEEIRDLNLFAGFYTYHYEGEIAAKLVVPRRQIQCVVKFDRDLTPAPAGWPSGGSRMDNSDFIPPDRLSNIIQEI